MKPATTQTQFQYQIVRKMEAMHMTDIPIWKIAVILFFPCSLMFYMEKES